MIGSKNQKKGQKIEKEKKDELKQLQNGEEINPKNPYDENYVISPPNGGWGWLVILSAFYINVVVDGIQLTFGIFLKNISEEFNADFSKVALAGSLMFGIHLLMGPVCAGFNNMLGLRPVTIVGALLCCFGIGISYFSTNYWFLYISFGIIGGMGLGLVYMNSLVITSLYFTSLLPLAIAIVVCGSGVGTMIFAMLGNFLLRKTTWKNSFLIEAALAGSMSIVAIVFKPLKRVKARISSKVSSSGSLPRLYENREVGETSYTRKKSLFIKMEVPRSKSLSLSPRVSFCSIATLQSVVWNFAENMVAKDLQDDKKESKFCNSCRKRKKKSESKRFLLLEEIKSDHGHRKSYVEKVRSAERKAEKGTHAKENPKNLHRTQSVYRRTDIKHDGNKMNKIFKTLKKAIVAMIDCRLLKSYSFFLFTLSGALQMASFLIVFIYERDRIEKLGFSEDMSVYFIVALGGANVFWRLFLGCFALIPKINYQALSISGIILGGIATMGSCFYANVYFQFAFCCLFGLGMASFAVFRMVLLVDLVGVELVATATGINLLFMGVFSIISPPLFGYIMEITKDYKIVFAITGGLTVISGLMLIGLEKVNVNAVRKKSAIINR